MRILAISGSLREASSNSALVRAISGLAPDGVTIHIYDGLGTVPPYSPDVDTDDPPTPIRDLRRQLDASDGALICTPEYAFGMPGVLKNALDWLVSSGHLYRKPVAALSASPSHRGGDRALAWLCQTLSAQHAVVPDEASFPVPFVRQILEGDRLVDPAMEERLRAALVTLAAICAGDSPDGSASPAS